MKVKKSTKTAKPRKYPFHDPKVRAKAIKARTDRITAESRAAREQYESDRNNTLGIIPKSATHPNAIEVSGSLERIPTTFEQSTLDALEKVETEHENDIRNLSILSWTVVQITQNAQRTGDGFVKIREKDFDALVTINGRIR
jgi:hypothetical protein